MTKLFYFSGLVSIFRFANIASLIMPPQRILSSLMGLMWRLWRLLSFLIVAGFLVLTACAGGGGAGSSGGPPSAFEVELTFAPIPGGFRISNQSDFGDFVVLRITATSGENVEEEEVKTGEFVDDSYDFTGLLDLDWKFEVIGILSDGGEQRVEIDFVWAENEADHNNGGIRPGANYDGDGRANSVDPDDDNDGVDDTEPDRCRTGAINWTSNSSNDNDGDGCRDRDEDDDDDNDNVLDSMDTGTVDGRECRLHEDCDDDGVNDDSDQCRTSVISWTSDEQTDNDNDGCRDAGEDTDDDNDGLDDDDPKEDQSNSDGVSCRLLADCDNDTIRDIDEVAVNCVTRADCDNDDVGDAEGDACPVGVADWTPSDSNDEDGDGCRNDEDIDDDGDGLIELATHEALNAVRYALNGNGSRSAENAALDTTGCGGDGGITECSGYELVADISLLSYVSADSGKGWQPLGHDIDGATTGCQGTAFNGTFDGNGWTISDLNISRSAEDCVGLFGHMARGSEIRNLTLSGEAVTARNRVGALVGEANFARIVAAEVVMEKMRGAVGVGGLMGFGELVRIDSSSVEVAKVEGVGVGARIGGLAGSGERARIHSSSVVVAEVSGGSGISGLVGYGRLGRFFSSSVVAAEVSGFSEVSGLLGDGQNARVHSSSVVVNRVSGTNNVGGLVGAGERGRIHSSSVVVNKMSGDRDVGGLVGGGSDVRIVSSSVVVGKVSGNDKVGGLAGSFDGAKVAYSYVVSGTNTPMLVGEGSGANGVASYWDSDTSEVTSGNIGAPQTTSALRGPTGYEMIYATWEDNTNLFGEGNVPLAVWCDEDNSGSIEAAEQTSANLIWDFGDSDEYPAINCTPTSPAEWRNWWFLNTSDKPQIRQSLLDERLPSSN